MKIRLGYACISKTINETMSSPYSYHDFSRNPDFEKLKKVILSNLKALEELIDYNIKNNIHFFRLSSKLIPLATTPDITFDYITPFKDYYERIRSKIKINHMRIDFHPDQFCVLNSTRKEVLENTFRILEYHYKILEALDIEKKILVLHIGSSVLGKENAMKRFINNFNKLPNKIKNCIVIENDDKVFNIEDCFQIHEVLNIPIVLDYHHHICNPSNIDFKKIFLSWKDINPKIHFSSPKSKLKKEFRSHHDYIDSDSFINFIEKVKKYNIDIDIMIEAKAKDDALFKLVRELKYKTNYKFLDETTFEI